MIDKLLISNGPTWNLQGDEFYMVCSGENIIYKYKYSD